MAKCKKLVSFVLCGVMALSFNGCGKKETTSSGDGIDTISVFCTRSASLSEEMKDYNDVASFQKMEELTGVKVEWTLPPSSGYDEKFNLMIASGNYTDVIVSSWKAQGAEKFYKDGIIINLLDYKEYMPNFMAYTEAHPEFAKDYISADGKMFYFPYIREELESNVFYGPLMRQDWLDKLGLDVPTTSKEMYQVLKAFKEKDPNGNGKADEIPMTGVGADSVCLLLNMFSTHHGFYLDGDKVVYGLMEDNFTEGISYIAKLYEEGLLDADYVFQDRAKQDGKITNNKAGFMYSYQPTTISNAMAEKDPTFKLVGIPNLKNKDGKRATYFPAYATSVLPSEAAAITTACENPAAAVKWLDSFYSEEGIEAMNFGIEGETYTKENGECVFTDLVMNNPEHNVSKMFGRTSGVFNSYFPSVQLWASYSKSLSSYGKAAIETWAEGTDISGILPSINFTEDEKKKVADYMAQIETYADETVDQLILGQKPVSALTKVRAKIKEMGIGEVLKIYQTAYDRYRKTDVSF